jgi:hypothetical protein
MRRALLAPAILISALGACVTASVESRPLTPDELYSPAKGQSLEGVIFYEPRPYLLTYVFTQFDPAVSKNPADKNAPATDSCWRTIQHTELLILPDFAHPRIMTPVRYGIGTSKLSVQMANGLITSVNSDGTSTLADALKAVTGGAVDIAGAIKAVAPVPANARRCNTGAALAMIEPIDWAKLPIRFGKDTA